MVGNIYITGGANWQTTDVNTSTAEEIFTLNNVGIGTDNPSADYRVTIKSSTSPHSALLLDTTESDYNTNLYFAKQGTNKWIIGNRADNDSFRFVAGSTERLRITSAGSVGIGTDNPATNFKLDVNGDLSLGETGGANNTFIDQKQDGHLDIINSGRSANNGRVRINKTNSIGGDTTYFRDFEVYDGKDNLVLLVDGSSGNIGIGTDSNNDSAHFQHYQSEARYQSFQSSNGDLAIVTDNNSNPAAYIKGTGNAD